MEQKTDYSEFDGFEFISLEASYIERLTYYEGNMDIKLDAAPLKGHPLYRLPDSGMLYASVHARINIRDIVDFKCIALFIDPSRDAENAIDFGHIDAFYQLDGEYHLMGDIGYFTYKGSRPSIEYIE